MRQCLCLYFKLISNMFLTKDYHEEITGKDPTEIAHKEREKPHDAVDDDVFEWFSPILNHDNNRSSNKIDRDEHQNPS